MSEMTGCNPGSYCEGTGHPLSEMIGCNPGSYCQVAWNEDRETSYPASTEAGSYLGPRPTTCYHHHLADSDPGPAASETLLGTRPVRMYLMTWEI